MTAHEIAVLAIQLERIAKALRGPGFGGWSSRTDEADQLQEIANDLKERV
jgi:hypothetical protein